MISNIKTTLDNTVAIVERESIFSKESVLEWVLGELWPLVCPSVTLLESLGYGAAVLIPTGSLSNLPLHVARPRNGDDGRCANERVALSFAPSARLLARARNTAIKFKTAQPDMLAIVDPSPTSAPPLPLAAAEVAIVSSRFVRPWGDFFIKPRVLSGRSAARESVFAMGEYQAIRHFACHARYDLEEPLRSGILLANDELCSAADFMRKNQKFRFTVLSCCESAKSGTDAASDSVGLPGLIMASGSSGVIGTLWPVYDLRATLLMLRFYDFFIDDKNGPIQALSRAQAWLVRSTWQEKAVYLEEGETRMKERDLLGTTGKRFEEIIKKFRQSKSRDDYRLNLSTRAAYVFVGV